MPPRLRLRSLAQLAELQSQRSSFICSRCQYATVATTPAPSQPQLTTPLDINPRYNPVQPPSHRDPAYRKSQLLRAYVSLLQSTPLIVLFQHNNLKAQEWAGIRRELERALQKVEEQIAASNPEAERIASNIKISVVKPTILEPAVRIAEYYNPLPGQAPETGIENKKEDPTLTHALSVAAYKAAYGHKGEHPLTPLLTGSVALLTFPSVSPQYLKAALSILSPTPGASSAFPAPTRKATPSYHEPAVQDGLKKLILLGARVDEEVFDMHGTRWVGSIDGGVGGLRAQVVSLLQNAGVGVARTLEMAGQNLWFTIESRRQDMEPKEGGEKGEEEREGVMS